VPEAADALGVTVDAIRGRIRRGALDSERESGTVYVWVDSSELDSRGPSPTSQGPSSDQAELVEALRDQVSYLRDQLDEERRARTEERRRQDTIIAQLTARIPELEAPRGAPGAPGAPPDVPSGARGSPETASEGPGEAWDTSQHSEATATERPFTEKEAEERLSWWRRWFGG
jgi:hypothetical protein